MRLSAKAQYACVAMVDLACSDGAHRPVHLRDISVRHDISQRFLVQIMLQLKASGLVDSTRGAGGGYLLAKPAQAITLADILHAIDQPPASSAGALAGLVETPPVRTIRAVLKEIQIEEEQRLADVTLADLARRSEPRAELVYQI